MKYYCILIFSLCSVIAWETVPDDFKVATKAHHDACAQISKLDQGTIYQMRSGTFDDTNPAVREHIHCYVKKAGFFNDNDEAQETVMKMKMSLQVTDEAAVDKVIKKCISPKSVDTELWICKMLHCFYEKSPGVIIL